MSKLLKAVKQICKTPKRKYKKIECRSTKPQKRKFAACVSAGKRFGNIEVWGKLCGLYSENR